MALCKKRRTFLIKSSILIVYIITQNIQEFITIDIAKMTTKYRNL